MGYGRELLKGSTDHLVNVRDRWGNEALPDVTSEGAEPAGAAGSARRHWLKRRNTRADRW